MKNITIPLKAPPTFNKIQPRIINELQHNIKRVDLDFEKPKIPIDTNATRL